MKFVLLVIQAILRANLSPLIATVLVMVFLKLDLYVALTSSYIISNAIEKTREIYKKINNR